MGWFCLGPGGWCLEVHVERRFGVASRSARICGDRGGVVTGFFGGGIGQRGGGENKVLWLRWVGEASTSIFVVDVAVGVDVTSEAVSAAEDWASRTLVGASLTERRLADIAVPMPVVDRA